MPSSAPPSSSRPHNLSSAPQVDISSSSSDSGTGSSSDSESNQPKTVAELWKRKHGPTKKSQGYTKQKRPKKVEKEEEVIDKFSPYHKFAAWHIWSQNAFASFYNVLDYGVRYENNKFGKLTTEKWMNDAARGAHGNDIKGLLTKGLIYVGHDLPGGKLEPPIDPEDNKDKVHGHNHIALSRLLCPVRFHQKVLQGSIKCNDEDFLMMLYPQPNSYDPDDIEADLLQNLTLVHETLDWWNYQALGIIPEKSDDESNTPLQAMTLQCLCEQCATKAAAAGAEEAAVAAAEAEAAAALEAGAPGINAEEGPSHAEAGVNERHSGTPFSLDEASDTKNARAHVPASSPPFATPPHTSSPPAPSSPPHQPFSPLCATNVSLDRPLANWEKLIWKMASPMASVLNNLTQLPLSAAPNVGNQTINNPYPAVPQVLPHEVTMTENQPQYVTDLTRMFGVLTENQVSPSPSSPAFHPSQEW
ncbi:hypothetical protein CPB84DRAFT_1844077 [Gymnopilus junonius]|uniref:Uncharacterized protein n=1 Tax=Gymnopilus junonius TaxID=109634 RepID=A0A9P5TQL2_GYMJU|nr:hypothetical protein CPB84DRAFT_1844077 [Gymnopilus junonius]